MRRPPLKHTRPTAQEELNATKLCNFSLVFVAFLLQIGRIAVEDVYVGRVDVDVAEEVLPHEAVVRLGMVARQANVLVHVERHDVLERQPVLLMQRNQGCIRR